MTTEALVMNMRTGGMGQYANYPFNSLFKLGGNYFGLSDTGIEVLGGTKDLGADIPVLVVSGLHNLGTDNRKILTDAYLEVRCEGQMRLTVVYNETEAICYTLDPVEGKQGIYFKRIKLARGVDCTHAQVKLENVDGADFDLQSARIITQPKTRRIG